MMRSRVVAVLAVIALVGSVLAAGPASARVDLLTSRGGDVISSPNGDARHDIARVVYRLAKPAAVRARITDAHGDLVKTYRFGRLSKGKHVLRWDGKRPNVGVVPDGRYRVTLRAVRGDRKDLAVRQVVVKTPGTGRSATPTYNRLTVYPNTTQFHDEVRLKYEDAPADGLSATVRRPNGSLVRTLAPARLPCIVGDDSYIHPSPCALVRWDGRDGRGRVATAGRYVLRVATPDDSLVSETQVTVSDQPLVERTSTSTLPAAGWPAGGLGCSYPGAPMGCGDYICSPVRSERFAGGLSFRPGPNCLESNGATVGRYATPVGETGHEQFRVTATGGPTVAGAADTATLSGVTMQGDGSFTTPWMSTTFEAGALTATGSWAVQTRGSNTYDVATFTLEYTYYAPAS